MGSQMLYIAYSYAHTWLTLTIYIGLAVNP